MHSRATVIARFLCEFGDKAAFELLFSTMQLPKLRAYLTIAGDVHRPPDYAA
jgi:hypothetical protein